MWQMCQEPINLEQKLSLPVASNSLAKELCRPVLQHALCLHFISHCGSIWKNQNISFFKTKTHLDNPSDV